MSAHTPGPWAVDETGGQVIGGADMLTSVANAFGPSWDAAPLERDRAKAAEHYANARLIAAAPDMLAALREADSLLDSASIEGQTRNMIRAAIAKAEGALCGK